MTDLRFLFLSVVVVFSSCFGIIEGQTITSVYVQSNAPVTLTCPADDQATKLTWTGPGGTLYVTGTTVEADPSGSVKPRISAGHTGGSYTLTFTEFRSSDTGIYTCTVDGTVNLQLVVIQGMTSASPVYTSQGGTVMLQCPDTGGSASWTATSTSFIYYDGTDISPNIPDDTRTRLSVTRQDETYNLQISDVQLSDVREYTCLIGVTGRFYHLLLYIPPALPEIKNTVSVAGQNRTTGTEDGSMTLTCNSRGGTPAARVSWIKDGTTLVTSDNSVQYTKVFTRADDRTVYTCQSNSPALTSPQTSSVLVYLDLKPGQPSITDQLSQTENTNIQVVCVSTGSRPAAIIQWNVGGTWQSNNPTEVKVKDSATDTYTVTSTLSLPVTRQDNGKYVYCRASNQALSGGIESVRRSIIVLFGPDIVRITGNRVIVADSTNTLTLTCTTQEFSRHVHITWYNGTARILNTAGVTNTSGTYRGSVSTQVLQLTPDRYQDGNVIKCVVQNEDVTLGEKTASVSLNINYQPYLTLTPTPGVDVIEGGELEIRCDVDSKPAPSSITWSRVGGQLPSNSDVTSGVLRIPFTQRSDKGTYQCTVLNSAGTGQSSLDIDIYYPPDIQVTYTNTTFTSPDRVLTCTPDGNPDTYQFGQWRHTADDGTEIRQLTGSSSSLQSVLTLPDPGVTRRYEDTGYYVCEASNNIPDSSFYSYGSIFFVVNAPPVLITNTTVVKGQIRGNATMEVEFYSRPAVSSSDVSWTRGTDGLFPPDKFVTSLHTRSIQISFHGIDVKVKGYVAAITVHDLVEQDFGNYTVTIENNQGTKQYALSFKSASPPVLPNDVKILTYDSSSITLEWTPSFNGGAEQEFVLGYKSDVSEDYVDLAPIPDTHELTQSYQITGLKSGKTHFIRIYSENEIGRSGVIFLNQTTTAGEDEPSIGPLVGGIAGSALGLIAIAVVAVVIYKRRTATKDSDMEMINGHSRRSEDRSSDGIKPNILYESSDGLKANVLYESAGANVQPQPGPSSEYAIVSKPNKKNGAAVDPNSVYAVVEKSNKDKQDSNDVYAVVDKQPKEKGGKEQKKQPNKKKQQNKKKQPDKKNSKGGDEYENISSEQGSPEHVYANSKVDQIPSRVKNQDGLLYLEVEFKDNSNNERRAVIHGIENRTDYADVDFTQRADALPAEDESVEKTEENGKIDK